MENASKALIIAGAILLSILIIALGLFVYNQSKAVVNTNQLSAAEKNTFNSKITTYEGKQIGSTVKDLLNYLVTNASDNDKAKDKLPTVQYYGSDSKLVGKAEAPDDGNIETKTSTNYNGKAYLNAIGDIKGQIADSHYYTIETHMNNATGLVDIVNIYYK